MKHRSRIALLLALCMLLCLLPKTAPADGDPSSVLYYDPTDGFYKECTTYCEFSGELYLDSGWYVARGDIAAAGQVRIRGDVNLILCDGCMLTARGILLNNDTSLTIWAQSDGDTMGCLTSVGDAFYPGIGDGDTSGGSITINGGRISATGDNGTAGIGSGNNGDAAESSITINGGTVTATGGKRGAGIGCGSGCADHRRITINGGTVLATGGMLGSGIGGGNNGTLGDIIINGGTVTANGGGGGAGIGGGLAIGGNIIINGGTVTATGGDLPTDYDNPIAGPGIGSHGGNGNIIIGGGTVTAIAGPDVSAFQTGEGYVELHAMQVFDSDSATAPVTADRRLIVCGSTWAKLTPCTSHTYANHHCIICDLPDKWIYYDPMDETAPYQILQDEPWPVRDVMFDGWYAVDTDTELDERIRIYGDVNLILCDEKELTIPKGIELTEGGNLTVWTQSAGIYVGKLTVTAPDNDKAGIGSSALGTCGSLTIQNGIITVNGGDHGAAIGGGYGGAGGNVTINGGTVTAAAGSGAMAIGSGLNNTVTGTLTLSDLKVTNRNGSTVPEAYRLTVCNSEYAKIEPCDHDLIASTGYCRWCGALMVNPKYYDPSLNKMVTCASFTVLNGETTELTEEWYYVLPGTLEFNNLLKINGNVNLILHDSAVLNANCGISVPANKSLTIWGQSSLTDRTNTHGTGELHATTLAATERAAIGSANNASAGNIIINGGVITAEGKNGPGIGSSYRNSPGSVTINDGTVTATGGGDDGCSAGIGIDETGSLEINGGFVTATGGSLSAGIGSGEKHENGTIMINGGTVTATGGYNGAGIGSGYDGACGNIYIRGGIITAVSNSPAQCIGRGKGITYPYPDEGLVALFDMRVGTVDGNTVTWAEPDQFDDVCRSTNQTIRVEPMPHTITVTGGLAHGSIKADKTIALAGEVVTLTDTPDDGYMLESWTVTDAYNRTVTVTDNTFVVPDADVTVSAVFTELNAPVFREKAMVLTSQIGVKFKVAFPPDYIAAHKDEIRVDFEVQDGRKESMGVLEQNRINDNAYWFICYINPMELAERITANVYVGDTLLATNTGFSGMSYIRAARVLYADDTKLLKLLDALQTYGNAMQYALWKDDLVEFHESIPSTGTTVAIDQALYSALSAEECQKQLEGSGISDVRLSLTLNSDTKLHLYFIPKDDTVTIDNVHFVETAIDGQRCYRVTVSEIPVGWLDRTFDIGVKTSKNHEARVQASVLSYLYAAVFKSTFNEYQKTSMAAMYYYFAAAIDYDPSANR